MQAEALAALGERLGRHALPGFLGLLVLLLSVCAVLALALAHRRKAAAVRSAPDARLLLAGLAIGFAAVIGLAALFAEISEGLGDGHPMGVFDEALSRSIGAHTPRAALHAFAWLTHLADPVWITLLCIGVAALLWRARHRSFSIGWVLAVAGNAVLNTSLKRVFERARPVHDHELVTASGFSFPSGHSSGAVVCYGMLAYLGWRLLPERYHLPATLVAAAIVLGTACSRVFLQVHYPSDVLAGLCSGLAWLCVCIGSTEWARHRIARRR